MGRAEARDERQDRAGDGAWGDAAARGGESGWCLAARREEAPRVGFEVTGAKRSELAGVREPRRKSLLPDPRECRGPLRRDMIFSHLCFESC